MTKPFRNADRCYSGVSLKGASSRGRLTWLLLAEDANSGSPAPQVDPIPSDEEPEETRRRRVEAVLLIAKEPLPSRRLAQLTGLADATEARTLIRRLNELYDRKGRAMRVEEVAGGFQMMTRPQFAKWLRRLEHIPDEIRLTPPSLETLAIVAYRQPILRVDLEAIRGVGCGEVLRQLMQRDLVRICGRSEELGRPYLYGTTRKFLQLFGLQTIERLPRSEWVRKIELTSSEAIVDNHVSLTVLNDNSPSFLFGSETKESTVKMTVAANGLKETLNELVDPRLSPRFNTLPMVASDEDEDLEDDDFEDDDDEEEDDDIEEDEEFDDEEDEEFDDDEEEVEEEFEDEEGEEEWEEVEGDDDEEDEDEDDDEEWDDEEGDDWDDDDDDEEDEEEEEEADWD